MEDLNIKGMFKNKKWAPKLQRISLYKLVKMIKYKAEWYKKNISYKSIDSIHPANYAYNCRYQKHDLTLSIKEWTCPICKTKHNRDINASKNILQKAIQDKYCELISQRGIAW